ncbi:MAG: M23 family metallopeptidase [Nocardioidaceae bacterium]
MMRLAILLTPLGALLALVFLVVAVLGQATPASSATMLTACDPVLPASGTSWHLTPSQWQSARTIIAVGRQLHVPARGWAIAIAASLQESGLLPLPYGDKDSLGLFQQRSAWGSKATRMDPATSAAMFFTGGRGGEPGLLDVFGWQRMPLTLAAQAVQRSGFPDAYAQWEPVADAIVSRVGGSEPSGCAPPGHWVSPVQPGSFVLTAGFGQCGSLWQSCHTGVDFAAPTGTPAMAAADGVVVFSGVDGPYGNLVRVLHPGGIATWYGHLDRRLVQVDQHVAAGEVVGLIGQTGNATGPHLHFEVRIHATRTADGTPIDPHRWLINHHALK